MSKMSLMFDPEKEGKRELRKVYERVFELREKRPEDFIWSAFFSVVMDAREGGTKVFIINEEHGRRSRILNNFKRV